MQRRAEFSEEEGSLWQGAHLLTLPASVEGEMGEGDHWAGELWR